MPIPWLVLLQNVPWIDVVKNAPKVAEGARKLWNTVRGQPSFQEVPGTAPGLELLPDTRGMARVQARFAAMERAMAELHGEMLASSELIRNLAEQNTQLVVRIEANRVRTLWLTLVSAGFGVIAVVALILELAR